MTWVGKRVAVLVERLAVWKESLMAVQKAVERAGEKVVG